MWRSRCLAEEGVEGFDAHQAYEAALRNAAVVPPVSNVGRKGLARSMYRGYADGDVHEGLSWTLEGALNDFGLAQMAGGLAAREKPCTRTALCGGSGILPGPRDGLRAPVRPRHPVLPRPRAGRPVALAGVGIRSRVWGGDYTEANALTFAFTTPRAAGLAGLLGGEAALAQRLGRVLRHARDSGEEVRGLLRQHHP